MTGLGRYETGIDIKEMASYKGFKIDKSWEIDWKGNKIANTTVYMVYDDDEDWIGDVYKTLKEAHRFIDDYILDMGGMR